MKRSLIYAGISAALTLAIMAQPREALAEFPNRAFYIGGFGGGTIRLREWDLGENLDATGIRPDHSGMLGLRLGFHLLSRLALEAEFAWLPMASSTGDRNAVLTYQLDIIFHLLKCNWTPVVEAGFGAYNSVSGDLGSDLDPRVHLGVGLRGLVTPWMAIRVDVRDVISDGFDKWGANNLEITAGLDFFAWRTKEAVVDRDNDGVADSEDACPDVAGPKETRGCPDSDGDGIIDQDDQCPKEAGKAEFKGCPDTDGDGIADLDDLCPKVAGKAEFKGCPDTDGDGIPDSEDRCPKVAGKAEFKGCPDTDGDGITDAEDRCPKEAGKVELKGCPDRDRDGIADIDDKCPDQPGVKENQGCLPEAVAKKFAGAIKGIFFATGSAKILPKSHKMLDEAITALKEYPTLRLRVEGHTDNKGKAEKNQKLSQERADSVRKYLLSKGIEAGRVEAIGYGDTKPAQSNKNAKGRAANRRIEFTALGAQ